MGRSLHNLLELRRRARGHEPDALLASGRQRLAGRRSCRQGGASMFKLVVIVAFSVAVVSAVHATDDGIGYETVAGYFREYPVDQPGSGPAIVTVDDDD